jgi:hypothetical protein
LEQPHYYHLRFVLPPLSYSADFWNPPLETADALFGEALEGYKVWKVGGYLIVMRPLSGNKIEIEVVDPIKRITYHRNIGDAEEAEKLFGEALDYTRRHLTNLPAPPEGEAGSQKLPEP